MSQRRLRRLLSALRTEKWVGRRGLPETLTAAATEGDLRLMEVFLTRGADIEERTIGFASPLCAACAAGQVDAVRLLLARGAA